MSYEVPAKDSIILWQKNEETGVGEPALLIEFYSDCLQISQDGDRVNMDYDTIKDLIKVLKEWKDRRPS